MKFFTLKNIGFLLFLTQLTTLSVSIIAACSYRQSGEILLGLKLHPLIWNDVVEGIFEFGSLCFLVLSYLECLRVLIAYPSAEVNVKSRKVQLISALAFITPPNLFLIPNSLCTDLQSSLFGIPAFLAPLCYIKVFHDDVVLIGRLFLGTFTVLTTFADYRRVVFGILKKFMSRCCSKHKIHLENRKNYLQAAPKSTTMALPLCMPDRAVILVQGATLLSQFTNQKLMDYLENSLRFITYLDSCTSASSKIFWTLPWDIMAKIISTSEKGFSEER
ncbi:hypothetical protein L596_012021 [Steinernema carpocapsae]|uniref:Uncharacterized protein n=1 Tax=Steinernema carpocapsae TaxID=34508 RepID=A0A4U5NWP0_STECR|nr:hypothetical protein L596_012021 [Steinernema carpocapsae]